MKAIKFPSLAAAVLLMIACSSDNDEPKLPEQPVMIPFHATIDGPGSATRTTYTTGKDAQEKNIVNAAWTVGDKIALIHNGKLEELTVKTVNSDGSATVSGTITYPSSDNEKATVVYPYFAVGGALDGKNFDYSYEVEKRLNSQNVVLPYTDSNGLDLREGDGTIVVEGGQGRFGSSVAMTSKIILWKFTLNISATQLKIEVMHDGYTSILAKAVKGEAASEFVMAVPKKIADLLSNGSNTLKITALGSDKFNYTYTLTKAIALETGKYYESPLTMTKEETSPAYYAATTDDIGKVIGSDGIIYASALPTGIKAVAKIVYVGTASTAFRGLAIALSDDAQNDWENVVKAAAGKNSPAAAPTGSTWFVPTVLDWQLLLVSTVELDLKNGNEPEYWTGTEISTGKAYYYNPSTEKFGFANKSNNYTPRACLAF